MALESDDIDSLTSERPLLPHHYRPCPDIHDERPILVGYAFGPKKMSTMTVVMAEASKSMMTEEEEEEEDDDDRDVDEDEDDDNEVEVVEDNDAMCEIAEEDVEFFRNLDDVIPSSSKLYPSTNIEHQEPYLHDNSVVVSYLNGIFGGNNNNNNNNHNNGDFGFKKAVGYFRSSCSSVAASDTAGSTLDDTMTISTTATTTPSSFGWKRSTRVSFVPLDLDIPLEEQHGGNMDIILHKLTEDILWVSQCSKKQLPQLSSSSSSSLPRVAPVNSSEQEQRIQRLLQYQRDHPHCSLVDDPTRVQVVMNRADIALLLQNHLVGVTSTSGWAVRSPRYLVVNQEDLLGPDSHHVDWTRRLQEARLRYPIIVKPLTAAGTKASHSMAILLQPSALHQFLNKVRSSSDGGSGSSSSSSSSSSGGYLWQEYVNHNAVLFKVYVLGPHVRVYPRPSLPNLPYGDDLLQSHPKHVMVEFDSQRPYPQLSDFFRTDSTPPPTGNLAASPPLQITVDEVQPIVQAMKSAFGLELFGFDILVTNPSTGCDMDQEPLQKPELWVVDVNYFPSYKEVSNFSSLLAQYLTQRAIQGRRGRSTLQHPLHTAL